MTRIFRGWAGSADALCAEGAIIACRIWPSHPVQEARRRRGAAVAPQAVQLMVDTGAAGSGVVISVARALGLTVRRRIPVIPVSQETFEVDVYAAVVELGLEHAAGPEMLHIPLDIVGLPESITGAHHGILGRDFLRAFDLNYRGPDGRFEIVQR